MATSKIDIVITAVDNLSSTVKKIEGNVMRMSSQVQRSTKKVATDTAQMATTTVSSLNRMDSAFGTISTNMRRIGALVGSFYAIRSAVTAVTMLTDELKKFDEAMAYTNTIAQVTTYELEQMTEQVRDLSVEMGRPADELASGLYDIYSSGFEGAKAMDVLKIATEGARAGMTETATSAKVLMAIMNAYNRKTAADTIDIMDTLFKVVDKGVVTYDELSQSFGSVTSLAAPLGVSLEEVGAALSLMTLRGIGSAEASTAIEGLLRSILKTTPKTRKAAKALGIEWNTTTLKAKGLAGMMIDLETATKGNEQAMSEVVPNLRGFRALIALTARQGEDYVQMLENIENHTGATGKALEKVNESINEQLRLQRAEFAKYRDELVGGLVNVELKFMENATAVLKWASENKTALVTVAKAVKDFTITIVALRVSIALLTGTSILGGFATFATKLIVLITGIKVAAIEGATAMTTLKATVMAIGPLTLTLTFVMVGFMIVMNALTAYQNKVAETFNRTAAAADRALGELNKSKANTLADTKIFESEMTKAEKEGNQERVDSLRQMIGQREALKKWEAKLVSVPFLKPDLTGEEKEAVERRIDILQTVLKQGMEELNLGGMSFAPDFIPEMPSIGGFDYDSVFGEGADKIADTIKKVTKEVSEFYIELGDLSNEHAEALSDEADAFEEAILKWERYLEDINISLTRMQDEHKKTIAGIQEDVAMENRDFSESMDDRAKKFQDTMDDINQSHSDNVEDIQHQLDLELGMGLRADKEKIAELQKRLARENRDYAQSVEERQEEKDLEDSRERRANEERLENLKNRLAEERLEYEQKTADIQKALEREKVDYAKQQDEIRKKSNDTLRGIVEDYQKAFKDIFDAIRDSGVPSLLAQLPGLTQGAMDASIQGVQIPENYSAEEEFVKNWQGLYGRLPTDDEINMGVYGTTGGATNTVNVNIVNPVVTNQAYIDEMTAQIQIGIGQAMEQAANGAN